MEEAEGEVKELEPSEEVGELELGKGAGVIFEGVGVELEELGELKLGEEVGRISMTPRDR